MITNSDRKMLQDLQSSIAWEALERLRDEYIEALDLVGPIKRENEFETIWQRAYNEGGRDHIRQLFDQMFNEAKKYV